MGENDRLLAVGSAGVSALLQAEVDTAKAFALEQHAPATRRAYRADWRLFEVWCAARAIAPLPATPEIIATFLGAQAASGSKASTLGRRTAAIRYAHALAKHESPTNAELVKATLRGIRRTLGVAPTQKAPATAERLLMMVHGMPDTRKGLRDKALLLLGFAGAFRRSELVAINIEDIEHVEQGLRITLRRSKTDQEGHGQILPILRGDRSCPVAALVSWLSAAEITEGAIFRRISKGDRVLAGRLTAQSVALVVKSQAQRVGYNPDEFVGHSLRAGFATSAVVKGASLFRVMEITRHKSTDTLRGYVRRAEEFREHAAAGLL